jgi:hypothetical protein
MPTVLRDGPHRFHFYSSDAGEPRHVHVRRDDDRAKFWLDPVVRLAANDGFGAAELRQIQRKVEDHRDELRRRWDEYIPP